MAAPYYRLIRGSFVLIGKEPDGDSVRFRPDNPSQLQQLERAYLIKPSPDGTVQLRFEAIDATELHYGGASQPFGAQARDALLKAMGWKSIAYKPDKLTVTSCTPKEMSGAILAKEAEANGRPVSFVLVGKDADVPASETRHGWTHLSQELLTKTLNHRMLRAGMAYPTFYTSLPSELRPALITVARSARAAGLGFWPQDSTGLFRLTSPADIGPASGHPILPKLFRRSTDYLKDVAKGFVGTLPQWIQAHATGTQTEDDLVEVPTLKGRVRLSSLLQARNDEVAFLPDLMEVVFVEQ